MTMLVVTVTNQKLNLLHLDHQKLQIRKVQKSYNKMITCDPDLKQIFPDPTMIFIRVSSKYLRQINASQSFRAQELPVHITCRRKILYC